MLIGSIILLTLIGFAALFHKINIPLIILSLIIGIVFGSDVSGIIYFDDYNLAKNIANIALMFILFTGGFNTKKSHLQTVIKPVSLLASVGIMLTASITGYLFHLITGSPLILSFLIGTILSSTDAAAVFSILKNNNLHSKVKSITEMESVLNDPMAIVLTLFILDFSSGTEVSFIKTLMIIIWKFIGGIVVGISIGLIAVKIFNRIRKLDKEFFYIYLLAVILFSYAFAEKLQVSGMISTFFAGFILGNNSIPYKKGLVSFNNAISFITNTALFVLLGLLVFPKNFSKIWDKGVIVFLIISFVARPVTVYLLTLSARLNLKEKIFISWSGIKGAVPIVLATYPAALGLDKNHDIFNIVFFAVSLSMIIQGSTLTKLLDLLNLKSHNKSTHSQTVELVSIQDTNYEIIDVFIDPSLYEGTCKIHELKLPPGTLVIFINRHKKMITPSGSSEIQPNDILTILVDKEFIVMIPIEIMRSFVIKNLSSH